MLGVSVPEAPPTSLGACALLSFPAAEGRKSWKELTGRQSRRGAGSPKSAECGVLTVVI